MPSPRPTLGVDDLKTLFPEVAAEADGWDPLMVKSGSSKKLTWKCKLGHKWTARVADRTPPSNNGCPYCKGRRALSGFNDLATLFPDIARQADGWDPALVMTSSGKKLKWRCDKGHTWSAVVKDRTPPNNNGCPYCKARKVLEGFNDLAYLSPEIAAEAYGWDPVTFQVKSSMKKEWRCNRGHIYQCRISDRTPPKNSGCPYCIGKRATPGLNDLETLYPEIASQANGWDPSTITVKSFQRLSWKCEKGHEYLARVSKRTPPESQGCPYCSGVKVLRGFNDLESLYPNLAIEADGWDPRMLTSGSEKKLNWRCSKGHKWLATVVNRTLNGSGCPTCAEFGFKQELPAWFYLMYRAGEQQIGISNYLEKRIKTHEKSGWILLDCKGPADGKIVYKTEALLKKWLRQNIGIIDGTTENWSTTCLEVQSLVELKSRSGIETDLF
ncbi:MAG: zinc-ribbon domain-containing protein [Synechococcaceae cyanobacterium ELA739]